MMTMLGYHEQLILFFCIKNLLIARLCAVVFEKNASVFLYNRKIIKQTLLIWVIACVSEFAGYFLKSVLLTVFYPSAGTQSHGINGYMFSPLFNCPVIAVISFLVSIGLCIALVFLLKKPLKAVKPLNTALIIGFSCAPYFIAFPLADPESIIAGVILLFHHFFLIIFIPYCQYKHFSSLVYRVNLKRNNAIDNRINCILTGFIGECAAILVLALLGTLLGLNLYFASPNYGNPRVASFVFLIAFCVGLLTNTVLSFFWSCKPYRNIKSRINNTLVLSLLNAPYILFIVLLLSAFV